MALPASPWRHWRSYGTEPLPTPAEALDQPLRTFPSWFLKGLGVQFYFGGTSLLIVVGVAMDTVQQLEAQLVMRNYEGFARKGRLRGRR